MTRLDACRRPSNNLIARAVATPRRRPSNPGKAAWDCDGHTWVSFLLAALFAYTNARRIYKEIGPGTRVALSKLAIEKFEDTGRPLRIAIDTSIWLFQIQASKGMQYRECAG
jgi:hypothetical protein